MDTGPSERRAYRASSDEGLVSFVSRVAVAIALVIMIALPVAYWSVAHQGLATALAFKAKVRADAESCGVSWMPPPSASPS